MCHGAASTAIPAGGSLLRGPGTQVIPGSKFTAVTRNREQGQQGKGTARGRIKAAAGNRCIMGGKESHWGERGREKNKGNSVSWERPRPGNGLLAGEPGASPAVAIEAVVGAAVPLRPPLLACTAALLAALQLPLIAVRQRRQHRGPGPACAAGSHRAAVPPRRVCRKPAPEPGAGRSLRSAPAVPSPHGGRYRAMLKRLRLLQLLRLCNAQKNATQGAAVPPSVQVTLQKPVTDLTAGPAQITS